MWIGSDGDVLAQLRVSCALFSLRPQPTTRASPHVRLALNHQHELIWQRLRFTGGGGVLHDARRSRLTTSGQIRSSAELAQVASSSSTSAIGLRCLADSGAVGYGYF
jgi:hypothetical protein